MPNQAYRLRILDPSDPLKDLVITSVASGTNPYIASPPSGDGQEVDLLTGAVRTGAYVVEVVDVVTGSDGTGTLRVMTNQLYDSSATTARPHLLSRRAFVEMSTDNGVSWAAWCAGYVSNIRQIDAIRYAVTVSNTRRVEQTKQVFTWQTAAERTAFPKRGCIFGGPIIGGLGGGTTRTIDSGGWTYQYKATTGTSTPVAGDTLALSYVSGAFYPLFEQKKVPGPNQSAQWWRSVKPYLKRVSGDASAVGAAFTYLQLTEVFAMPDLTAIVTDPATGNQWLGEVRGININPSQAVAAESRIGSSDQNIYIKLYAPDTTWPTLPSANTALRVRVVTRQVSEASPVYIQTHPADLAKKLYEIINIPVNTAAYNAVVDALGANLRVTYRITAAQTMAEFLEQSVFGPFGFAARINGSGEVEFFTTRVLNYVAPSYTIATADIVGDQPPTIYDLDEATVVTGFTLQQSVLASTTDFNSDDTDPTPDGIYATTQTLEYASGDTSTYSTRVVSYAIPGMVTDKDSFVPTFAAWSQGVTYEGFERFGRGAVNSEVAVLRTAAAAAAQVGDFVYLNASYYPNRNYRIGESSVGSRVAQVVRREERPESVVFKLVDAGGYVQPATAATVSLAKSTSDPRRVAQFTITNAATLNSGNIGVAVEWATGASAPAAGKNGNLFTRYPVGQVPTGAVQLPGVKLGGTTVYVRARSEVPGIFPSAWSGWSSVALDAWTAPTGVTVGTLTNQTAAVSWSLNGNTTDKVDVYVAPGSVAPSDWTPYRINTLPEGTTSTLISELTASTAYIVGIAFRDVVAKIGQTPVTATFTTTSSTSGTCAVPAGLAVLEGVNDVNLAQGVVLALWPSVGASSFILERAPNLTSGVTDYPGTYAELAVLPSTTETYIDYLPRTGAKYWYRIKHRTDGQADSAYVPQRTYIAVGSAVYAGVMGIATGIPSDILRPPGAAVVLTPESLYDDAGPLLKQLLIRLQYTDPQNRVVYYEYRTRERIKKTWGAWSAWTGALYPRTDLTYMQAEVTLANTSYIYQTEWRVYAADAEGNVSFFRTGTTEWPQNYGTNKAIVKVQKQGYNASTGKYEVWWRYYFDRGNNTLDEDGEDNTQQTFTTQVVAASVRDQFGTTASGVVTSGVKTASGWFASWTSTPSQAWTFEISVDTAMPTQYYLQYQDADYLEEQFVSTTTAVTATAIAASPTGEYPSTLFNIPNNGSDVSTAMASAISTIDSLGGGTLLLQAGTYDLSADLSLPRSVSLRGDYAKETIITSTTSTTRYVKVTGSGDWNHTISDLTFKLVGIVYGNTINDYGNGATLRNCVITEVNGAAVTYRFNSWLTLIDGCRFFDNLQGVLCDWTTNGTGTVSITGTTATFSASQSGLIDQRIIAAGQVFQVTAGSGTSWTVTPSASPAITGATFRYGVVSNSGAAMKIVNSDIFCNDAWNATRTTYCIQMLGGTTDGYQLFVDNCDLEHVNGAVVSTVQNWSDGGIFLNNVNIELVGNLSSPNTAGYFVNNDGAKVFLDGFVALSTTEKAWFKQSAGLIYVQKGRGSFLANRLAEITGGVIITDQGSWFGEGRPFTNPSNALALSPNTLSTGGMFVTTRNWLSLLHDKTLTALTPGAPTQQPINIQPFDGNDRMITFDFASNAAASTDNILRVDMANGVTGPPRIDLVLPNVTGIGHLTILHKPRRPTDWDNATLVNGAMTISGYFVETATNLTTAISATVADDGPPYTTKTLTFTTIAVTGGTPVPATITITGLTEQAAGPKLTGI